MDDNTVTPIPLMQLISGFWASKTLASAVELDLFTQISPKGATVDELSEMLGIDKRPAEMLLSGCASLGLLEISDGRFVNSPMSDEYLVRGKPYYFGGVITMLDTRLYIPWNNLTEAIRTNKPQNSLPGTEGEHDNIFDVLAQNPEEQRIFTEAMHSFSVQSGKALAEAFNFGLHTQLLDVGGGSGAYCIEAVKRYPSLLAVVFDLPTALEIAKEKVAEAGLSGRISTMTGDFFGGELPRGADVILLSMIMHDWTREQDIEILRRCYGALPSGGKIIISELMMDDDKSGPPPAALMSLNMLIETEGMNYTWAEYTGMLEEVGFKNIERKPIVSPGANGILTAAKP